MSAHRAASTWRKLSVLFVLLFSCLFILGCGENAGRWWRNIPGYGKYWWQRGQPKSTAQLFETAQEKLSHNLSEFRGKRPELVKSVETIESVLSAAISGIASGESRDSISQKLTTATDTWFMLEGQLSVGSRAAYGELASQMRTLNRRIGSEDVKDERFRDSLDLFSARVLSFLANELSVPAPVAG